MVLKWLLRKKTLSSSSFTAAVSSHSPWYVSWEAVDSRNCSAISPGVAATSEQSRGTPGCPRQAEGCPRALTFGHQVGVAGVFAGDDLLHQLVVAELAHGLHHLGALRDRTVSPGCQAPGLSRGTHRSGQGWEDLSQGSGHHLHGEGAECPAPAQGAQPLLQLPLGTPEQPNLHHCPPGRAEQHRSQPWASLSRTHTTNPRSEVPGQPAASPAGPPASHGRAGH